MSNFLDKVGLQHVVEKIKGLLGGYLPLSGGTITGAIKFGNIILGALSISEEGVKTSKIVNKNTRTATFNINECNTRRFVLSRNPDDTGLIANNSDTVVSEVDEQQALKIFYLRETSSSDSKYIGEEALAVIYQSIDLNTSQAWLTVTQDTEALLFFQSIMDSSQVKIKMTINTTIHICKELIVMDNPEYVEVLVVKGMVLPYFKDFTNLKTFKSNGSYLLTDEFTDSFKNFTKLTYVDVNDWNIEIATNLSGMFYNCSALSNITLNLWDTRNVTNMNSMFAQCYSLEKLDITGWNMTNVIDMTDMFAGCSKIKNLLLSEGFGRMKDEVGTLDLSSLTLWTTTKSVQTLLTLYDRKANGLGVITIKLSSATKNALGASGIQTLTAKGYTIA